MLKISKRKSIVLNYKLIKKKIISRTEKFITAKPYFDLYFDFFILTTFQIQIEFAF